MGYPKNIKQSFDSSNPYGVTESRGASSFEETVAEKGDKLFLDTTSVSPTYSFGMSHLKEILFLPNEGLTVPNGASDIYTKTVPTGFSLDNVEALVMSFIFGGVGTTPLDTKVAFTMSGLRQEFPQLIFDDYRKCRFSSISGTSITSPNSKFVNLVYADAIAENLASTNPDSVIFPAYMGNSPFVISTSFTGVNSALVSLHFDREADTLVFKFKKNGATTGVSWTSGVYFIALPIYK